MEKRNFQVKLDKPNKISYTCRIMIKMKNLYKQLTALLILLLVAGAVYVLFFAPKTVEEVQEEPVKQEITIRNKSFPNVVVEPVARSQPNGLNAYTIDLSGCEGQAGGILIVNDLTKEIKCGTIRNADK